MNSVPFAARLRRWLGLVGFTFSLMLLSVLRADGLGDNDTTNVRRLPKLGVEVPADKRAELEAGLAKLTEAIEQLRGKKEPQVAELLPDVQIYFKAVHDALKYQEFFQPKEIDDGVKLLAIGQQRAAELLAGNPSWPKATGLVVRAYVSKIDGSVQPYGLVVPPSYSDKGPHGFRCDLWFHGRGEVLSELNFVRDRASNAGQFTPPDTIVLHPYGRWNNAFKLAGETDVLEALASVQRRYRIDEDRIAARGFSMGGAAAWHLAVHHADRWFAANPGAGFSETPDFLKVFQKEQLKPTWWEQKLWHLYDCPDWSANLRHCPTVAYSGENDSQKQAADIMVPALTAEKVDLVHLIGPKTGHSYHPQSRDEVERRLNSLARFGRERTPRDITFVTYTLKYNRMHWVTVEGLERHWERARIEARLAVDAASIQVKTTNVTDLALSFGPGECPITITSPVVVICDEQRLEALSPRSDRSWQVQLHKSGNQWKIGPRPVAGLRKQHDLQGPIDDAFMDSFLFVKPTGKARHAAVGQWSEQELNRAIEQWRRHFRGEARVKLDTEVTDADIANSNLILWGDSASNQLLGRIADQLPIRWDGQSITAGKQQFPAETHALIAIHPNPLNPQRYVVLNSGFTFREFAHLNNARQIPVLPDWAIVDLREPPNNLWPGKIAAADFFNEAWQIP